MQKFISVQSYLVFLRISSSFCYIDFYNEFLLNINLKTVVWSCQDKYDVAFIAIIFCKGAVHKLRRQKRQTDHSSKHDIYDKDRQTICQNTTS